MQIGSQSRGRETQTVPRPGLPGTPPVGHPPVDYDPRNTGINGTPQIPPGTNLPGGGNSNPLTPGSASTGNGSMPWLKAWEGPFAAPLSPTEQKGISGLEDFAEDDFGLGAAQDYTNRVFNGDYLSGNDPNFQEIQDSGQILKDMEDEKAMREFGSRYAAGGNAISGARMGTEMEYMRGSNAQFQNMMAQLRAANYGRERGFQQDAVQGQRGMMNDRLGGYGALIGAGGLERDVADREISGQYGDFLRQGKDFKDAYQYPDQLALQTAHLNYPGNHEPAFGESDSTQLSQWLAQLFGGGGGNLAGGIADFAGGLLGSGDAAANAAGYDGEETSFKPSSYRDSSGYNSALTAMQTKQAADRAKAGKAGGAGKAMTIMALLMQVLGLGKDGKPQNKGGSKSAGGGGQSLGSAAGGALKDLLTKDWKDAGNGIEKNTKTGATRVKGAIDPVDNKQNYMDDLPEIGMQTEGGAEGSNPFDMEGFSDDGFGAGDIWDTPGASMDENGLGQIDWDNYGMEGDYGQQDNQELSDFLGGLPEGSGGLDFGGYDDFGGDFGGGDDPSYFDAGQEMDPWVDN